MLLSVTIFSQLIIMMIIAIAGFVFAKVSDVGEREEKFISKILLYFINPCLIVSSFNIPFDVEKFFGLIFSIILSLIITLIFILISELFFRNNPSYNPIQKLANSFTNCGFIGIPLITVVFGSSGVFYLMGYLVVFNVLLWIYGYRQMSGSINLKKIFTNPNIIAVLIGLIIFVNPIKLPQMIHMPLSMIAGLNTAMSMIFLGILFGSLKKEWIKKFFLMLKSFFVKDKNLINARKKVCSVLFTTFIRLIFSGIISCGICYLVIFVFRKYFAFANLDLIEYVTKIVLIASLCPAGISVSTFACLFNKDSVYSNFLVCFTHILCVITIPLILTFFLNFI